MAIHSSFSILNRNGIITRVFCYNTPPPQRLIPVLQNQYTTKDNINKIFEYGYFSHFDVDYNPVPYQDKILSLIKPKVYDLHSVWFDKREDFDYYYHSIYKQWLIRATDIWNNKKTDFISIDKFDIKTIDNLEIFA